MNRKHSSNQRQRSAKKTSLENFKFLHRIASFHQKRIVSFWNRPFYRYGGHIELVRFKEYTGRKNGFTERQR